MKTLSAFPITPADASGRIDVDGLRTLLRPLIAAKVGSIGLLGSTGSYPYLSREQRLHAIEVAVDEVAGRVPLLVGVGALRTDETVKLAQDAKAAGAAVGLLAPVSYTPLTENEVFEHFVTVAGESGLPLSVYDNPGTTHFRFTPALVGRLSRVPGIVSVKSPAPEPQAVAGHLADLRQATTDGFSLGYSGDWHSVEALIAGGDVWYSVIGGIFPETASDIVQAVESGNAEEARNLNERLQPLWNLFKQFSSLRVVYACAEIIGLCTAVPPRPILPLGLEEKQKVADTISALGLGRGN